MSVRIARPNCKFCEFGFTEPTIFDAPELRESHALHILDRLNPQSVDWDETVRLASKFASY